MADGDVGGAITLGSFFTFIFLLLVFGCLYTSLNLPEFSIEEFSVPAFNKTSDHVAGDIYFDLKLRNMNKAVGLYYDDPLSIAFSYYPLEQPYQKYAWVSVFPSFYQGNGKTKHIKASLTQTQTEAIMVDDIDHEPIETINPFYNGNDISKHARSLLRKPTMVVEKEVPTEVQNFRINLIVTYRFKLLWDSSKHQLEVGADVPVDANTGERATKGSIKLV